MSRLRCLLVLCAALPFAACGGGGSGDDTTAHDAASDSALIIPDGTPGPDAAPGAYDCVGDPYPTTASDPIVVSGVTEQIDQSGLTPLGTVGVEAFNASDGSLDTTTSDSAGVYALSVPTGGSPLDGYVNGTKSGFIDSYLYPPQPLSNDLANIPVLMVSTTVWAFLPVLSHGATQPNGSGFIGLLVVDCNGNPVAGATVTCSGSNMVRYISNGAIGDPADPNMPVTTTDSSGLALIFDVTPGNAVTVDATADGHDYAQHNIKVRADVVTTTVVAPGPITGLAP